MALPDNPLTRGEQYLNRIATGGGTIPDEPLTRMEQYLDYIAKNGSGGGGGGSVTALKQTLLNLLIPILRQGLYGTDQEAAISALETALGGTPPVQTFVITNNLTNVTNSNEATAVNSGTAYTATLTPAEGMAMQTATVTMGGVDVTSTVYSNGTISIPSVTGNIVITAVAESVIETYTPTLTAGFITANGVVHDSTSYHYTSVIPCRAGDKVYGTCENSSYPGLTVHYIRSRFTTAFDGNGTVIESAGSDTQADFSQSNPFIVPTGVYGVTFSIVNALANNVVVYVDKSERTGA